MFPKALRSLVGLALVAPSLATAQTTTQTTSLPLSPDRSARPDSRWETIRNHPGSEAFADLDYTCLFVANRGREDEGVNQFPHLGTDVIASNNPAPMGQGGGLYAVLPGGKVEKLFPLPIHETIPGLIDTPLGRLADGAVVEPHISNDGQRVYFAWFHDQTWKRNDGGWLQQQLSHKGCDLYSIDLGSLGAPGVRPADLPIQRLTFKEYDGDPKADSEQTIESIRRDAMNPDLAISPIEDWGTCNLHMIEMETKDGLKAIFCSDRARLVNSNSQAHKPNHNFNLFIADIRADGSLGPARQFQYYTTTSALSPEPLRNGFTFSYQSSTENFRRWDLQSVDSSGKWGPLLGYAQSSELFHFGTLLTRAEPGGQLHDWFLGVKYYNLNNAGFGQLQLMDMADAGINEFLYTPGKNTQPEQLTTNLTVGVISDDEASPRVNVDGELVYAGKLTTPRAGRIGGEYLAAYTPTSANRWKPDATGEFGEFQSHIVYRGNMEPFEPYLPYSSATGGGAAILVKDRRDRLSLLWPTPVLSWQERHGGATQEYSDSIAFPNSPIDRGLPLAEVGTSAIWNTDLRPFDCFYGTGEIPFNPNDLEDNDEIDLNQSIDGLRYVQDPNDLCQYLLPSTVLGIQVNMTSNRPDWDALWAPGYETDATRLTAPDGEKEASRILGVFDVTVENQSDQSFMATIPADVPFDFHLLDSTYGMKLVDVRSWHSLQPRERRNDCGGCHQHERGFGIPFAGTEADQKPALDMAGKTSFYSYDPNCQPTLQTTTDPAVSIPEWTEDIWPEFSQKCGTCHDALQSTNTTALAALDFTDEESAFRRIHDRNYANTVLGALGSPVFWAAYGQRTDGRDNTIPNYQPNYGAGDYGYRFSSVHPGLCDGTDPAGADWVHRLGLWIDNHMPRNTGTTSRSMPYQADRFHPTVDFAYTEAPGAPNQIRVGFWDDEGSVTVQVYLDGQLSQTFANRPNGEVLISDGGLTGEASIRIIGTDGAGNRQIKEKTIDELRAN